MNAIFKEDTMKLETTLELPDPVAERVEQEVRNRTNGRVRGLRVQIQDGHVIITGRTSTYYAKQLVTHAALSAADHFLVMNEVEVC